MIKPIVAMQERVRDRWLKWIQGRSPKAKRVELDQRKIFIFPTRYGFFFLFTAFLLFMGGINYENSLILNLSFFLVSLFLVAILQTFKNLSGLVLASGEAKPAFKGQDALFQVILGRTSQRTFESLEIVWEGKESGSVNIIENSQQAIEISISAPKRGWYQPGRLKIQSTFPLGLLRTWSWVHLDISALVYPLPISCEYIGVQDGGDKEGKVKIASGQDEFEYLKNYQLGDSLKNVAWKKYATSQKLLSKVFYGVAGDASWLRWSGVPATGTELKLSMLCYWVITYSLEGRVFGLSLPSGDIAPSAGRNHELDCLRALALYGVESE